MPTNAHIILFSAVFVLGILLLVQRAKRPDTETFWFSVLTGGGVLWLLSVFGVLTFTEAKEVLWSARTAWLASLIAHPAFFMFLTNLLKGPAKRPGLAIILYATGTAAVGPAMLGDFVVESVVLHDKFPEFHYGNWIIVATSYHLLMLVIEGRYVVTQWKAVPLRSRNRLLVFTLSLLPYAIAVVVANTLLILATNGPVYTVIPALACIPAVFSAFAFYMERLPDVYAALGRLFPNAKSRILSSLDEFERTLSGKSSCESLLTGLGSILGARVSLASQASGECVVGPASGRSVWLEPGVWERMYGKKDRVRLSQLADQIDAALKSQEEHVPSVSYTGWAPESQIDTPRVSPWPVASIRALRAAETAARDLVAGAGILVLVQDAGHDLVAGFSSLLPGRKVVEVAYPDSMDAGNRAVAELEARGLDPRELLLVVVLRGGSYAEEFETAVAAMIQQGAKIAVVVTTSYEQYLKGGYFSGKPFSQFELPLIAVPNRFERFEDVSILLDHYLMDIETHYMCELRLAPEEKAVLCRDSWNNEAELMRALLERFVLTRSAASKKNFPLA